MSNRNDAVATRRKRDIIFFDIEEYFSMFYINIEGRNEDKL